MKTNNKATLILILTSLLITVSASAQGFNNGFQQMQPMQQPQWIQHPVIVHNVPVAQPNPIWQVEPNKHISFTDGMKDLAHGLQEGAQAINGMSE